MGQTPTFDADAFDVFESEGWEGRVDAYDRFFTPITRRLFDPLLDAVRVDAGTRLLDVATGPGHLPARAAERGATAIGVDVADAMVNRARELYPELEFRRADAESLPFEDGALDAVTANFLLPHLSRPEQAMTELVRVLAPGGRLALATWDVPANARLFGFFLEAVSEVGATPPSDLPPGPDVFRFADDTAFTELLKTAGLRDVEVSPIAFDHDTATFDDYWQALQEGTVRMSSLLHGQSRETLQRIRDALERRLDENRTSNGTITLPVSVKLAAGQRPG
jgi:SAM-dependent methyltransferase